MLAGIVQPAFDCAERNTQQFRGLLQTQLAQMHQFNDLPFMDGQSPYRLQNVLERPGPRISGQINLERHFTAFTALNLPVGIAGQIAGDAVQP